MKKLFFFFILIVSFYQIQAQEWNLRKNKKGIKIYTRKLKKNNLYEYKATMKVMTTKEKALKTLVDGDNFWRWNYKTSKSKTIEKVSDKEILIWMFNDFNWPIRNRDHISRLVIIPLKNGYRINIIAEVHKKGVPKSRRAIRVKNFEGYWKIIEKGNSVEITQQIYGDPAGKLPNWLINSTVAVAPYYSFYKLKRLLEK